MSEETTQTAEGTDGPKTADEPKAPARKKAAQKKAKRPARTGGATPTPPLKPER